MSKLYDIIVVGAGPAGLMAAKTAAEAGLKVLLLERKRNITQILRLCGQFTNVSLINVGGRLKYGYTKPISVEIGTTGIKFHFPEFGFSIDYKGPIRPYMNYAYISPCGNVVYREKNRIYGFFSEKEALLTGILDSVEKLGVKIMTETFGLRAENTSTGVRVTIKTPSGEETIEADKCIAADGKESVIAESAGLNARRKILATTPLRLMGYVVEGVATELRLNTWVNFTIPSLNPRGNCWMYMSSGDRNIIGAGAGSDRSAEENVNALMNMPAFKPWFSRVKIIRKLAVATSGPTYAPNPEPAAGNVLALGDAAALVEVTNPGAIACGYAGTRALIKQMNGDTRALPDYFKWWQTSFDTNDAEYLKAAGRNFAVNSVCDDAEIDYLYGLLKDWVGLPAIGIAENMERIRAERPALYEKLKSVGMSRDVSKVDIDLTQVLDRTSATKR
jgi:digeranylgeranylglycerophospholipid reductase